MDYKSLESERQLVYAKYKKNMLIGWLTVIFLIGFIFFAKAASMKRKFLKNYKQKLVGDLLEESYPGSIFSPNSGIPYQKIKETGMYLERADRYHTEDYITGTYKGVKFHVADVRMSERHVTHDSQGHTHVQYVQFFKGRWYVFDYEKDLNQTIKIKEARFLKSMNTKGLEKIEVESIAFSKKFKMYTSDPQTVFYIMTPVIIEKFMEIERMHKGNICFAFINGELHIGVNDNKDYLEPKINKPVTKQVVNEIKGQIDIIGAVINEFKLDTAKFKNK